MGDFFAYEWMPVIINMSLTAGVVIVFVLLARLLLRRAPKIFSYLLWLVVLFRLLCPVSVTADFSALGVLDTPVSEATAHTTAVAYIPQDLVHMPEPAMDLPLPAVGEAITEVLPQGAEQTAADPLEAPVAIAAWVWLAGVAVMAAYSAVSLARLRRRLVGAAPLEKGVWLADHIGSPFVLGLVRPRIYLPSGLSEEARGYILLHERHHIRRLDHVVKLLAFLALCVHWFNPLAWVFFTLLGRDMEMSCDEAVVRRLGAEARGDYSATLLSLATGRRIIAGAPLAFGEGDTGERVRNVLRWRRPRLWLVLAGAVVCLAVMAACAANPGAETAGPDSGSGAPSDTDDPQFPDAAGHPLTAPAKGEPNTLADAAYYLELAAGEMTFTEMEADRREALLAEYGGLLEGYTLLARESTDGRSGYILGCFSGAPEENPLHLLYSVEIGDYGGGTVQVLYREEDSAAVSAALETAEMPDVGQIVRQSRLMYTANEFQTSGFILIEPKDVSLTLTVAYNRYLFTPNGREYMEDAVSRGVALLPAETPYLYVYRIDEKFGELAECLPLTEEQARAIRQEEPQAITPGFGFAATLYTQEGSTAYTEATGVPQTVLDMAIERCDYRFADPGYVPELLTGAVLEGDWLEEPRYAAEADVERLGDILRNAEFGFVGSCGYGARVTLTAANGEQFTCFKGTDGCDTVVFGSWGGYFLGEEENLEFWRIFGLDPDTKEPLEA